MRILSALLTITTLATTATAQVDLNKIMAQQGAKSEDNNDPFVPNTFTGSFRMEMHMFKKGAEEKNSPTNIHYAFKEDMTALKVSNPEEKAKGMRMVYDLQNKFQFMLMEDDDGNRSGMKQKMKKVTIDADEKKDGDEMKIAVTDEYKVIDGHKCRKTTGTNSDSHGEWWVAEDVDIDMAQAMSMVEMRGRESGEYERFKGKGLPMEMIWEKNDGSEKIVLNTRDLVIGKEDAAAFDMDGYEIMDMTTMPGMPR